MDWCICDSQTHRLFTKAVLQSTLLIIQTTGLHLCISAWHSHSLCLTLSYIHTCFVHTHTGTHIILQLFENFLTTLCFTKHSTTFCCFCTFIRRQVAKNTAVIESFYPCRYKKHFFCVFFFFLTSLYGLTGDLRILISVYITLMYV